MRVRGAIGLALLLVLLVGQLGLPGAGATSDDARAFLARVVVDAPGGLRDDASFGAAPGATSGYDTGRDVPEPPPPPGGAWAIAYVVAPESTTSSRLARSLVDPGDDRAWLLRVEARGPAGDVRLSWNASDFVALPPGFGVDATHANATFDLVAQPTLTIAKPEGLWSADVEVRVHALPGAPPAAPASLTATGGAWPGEVDLAWSPPADDGGHPVRGYVVYRVEGDARVELARTPPAARTFRDVERPLGESVYAVAAVTRLAEGVPANASVLLLGTPAALAGGPEGSGREVAREDAAVPAGNASVPAQDAEVARVGTHRRDSDPRTLEVTLDPLGQGEQEVAVFTLVALPPEAEQDAELVHAPGADITVPGAAAGVAAEDAESAASPTGRALTLRFVVDGHRTSFAVAWLP